MWLKASKYAAIGFLNAAIDFCFYWVFIHSFGLQAMVSHLLAWLIVVQFSYIMNAQITFKQNFNDIFNIKKWLMFILSGVAALVVSSITLYILLPFLGTYGAKIAAIFSSFIAGFLLSCFVVFKGR